MRIGISLVLVLAMQLWANVLRVPANYATPAAALSAASAGDTILLEPGTHHGHLLLNFRITLASEFILSGDTADISATILRPPANTTVQVLSVNALDSTSEIVGLTITGGRDYSGGGIACHNSSIVIRENIIENNMADAGGGIYCSGSTPKILRNTIRGNTMYSPLSNPGGGICMDEGSAGEIAFNVITGNVNQDGGGIACRNSSPRIHHNIIAGNTGQDIGGGMRLDNSHPLLESNVIYGNSASHGGGLNFLLGSSPEIRNCIVWGNEAQLSGDQIEVQSGSPEFSYCTIENGWDGTAILEGDPLFRDADNADFHLQSSSCGGGQDSPCIDTGDPAFSDLTLSCEFGLGGGRSDIGAFGGGAAASSVPFEREDLPGRFTLDAAYPNPFNGSVTLSFTLPTRNPVLLEVFNVAGRKVIHDDLGYLAAGEHRLNLSFESQATGVYFARLSVGAAQQSAKLFFTR